MKNFLLTCFCLMVFPAIKAQNDSALVHRHYMERKISLLTGMNLWPNFFAELGIARNSFGVAGHHPVASCAFLSCETRIGDKLILAPKLGGWIGGGAGGMAMGMNLIYYSDLNEGSLRFRPEIGMGFNNFKVVYGYNFPLNNRDLEYINDHNLSIVVLIGLKSFEPRTLK